jgi:hypothetical protein
VGSKSNEEKKKRHNRQHPTKIIIMVAKTLAPSSKLKDLYQHSQ